jgi:TrmH family RNA methyltransferase
MDALELHSGSLYPAPAIIGAVRDGALIPRYGRARRDPDLAVLEGFHALKHALRFGADVLEAATPDRPALGRLAQRLAPDQRARMLELAGSVDAEVFSELVPLAPTTGVVALARRRAIDLPAVLADRRPEPIVLLEDPRDLGNMGACVRVAAAADAAGVITTGSHDPWHPDALRGAAGLHFALPVARVEDPAAIVAAGRPLLAVDPDGEPLAVAQLPQRALLAFGTERYGLSPELLALADARVSIPMRTGVSSLNLATAVAAVLFAMRTGRAGGLGCPRRRRVLLDAVEQHPVSAQRGLCARKHPLAVQRRFRRHGHQLADQVGSGLRVLDVARAVLGEVGGRRAFGRVAVVLDETLELRLGDGRLARLQHVQHREVLEQAVARRPGVGADARLRQRRMRGRAAAGFGEAVPQRDVLLLLLGVCAQARGVLRRRPLCGPVRGLREGHDSVPVLARVERQLGARQRACRPALVERVRQHVALAAGLVEAVNDVHGVPPCVGCRGRSAAGLAPAAPKLSCGPVALRGPTRRCRPEDVRMCT